MASTLDDRSLQKLALVFQAYATYYQNGDVNMRGYAYKLMSGLSSKHPELAGIAQQLQIIEVDLRQAQAAMTFSRDAESKPLDYDQVKLNARALAVACINNQLYPLRDAVLKGDYPAVLIDNRAYQPATPGDRRAAAEAFRIAAESAAPEALASWAGEWKGQINVEGVLQIREAAQPLVASGKWTQRQVDSLLSMQIKQHTGLACLTMVRDRSTLNGINGLSPGGVMWLWCLPRNMRHMFMRRPPRKPYRLSTEPMLCWI